MSKLIDSWNWKKPTRIKLINKGKLQAQKGIIQLYRQYWKCQGLRRAQLGDEIYYELHSLDFNHGIEPTRQQRERIKRVFPNLKKKYVHCDFKGMFFYCKNSYLFFLIKKCVLIVHQMYK